MNALIVDDEWLARQMAYDLVDWAGLGFDRVRTAENGKEAIERLVEEPTDLCLLDIRMPIMDGLDLLAWMRETGMNAEVILLSAFGEFAYARRALGLGARAYLLKPLDERELAREVRLAADRIRQERLRADGARATSAESTWSDSVKQAIAMMEARYAEKLTLEEICAAVNMSRNYFCSLFKKETGENVWDRLTRIRIREACRLMMETPCRMYEIAERVGYENQNYFNKVFKRATGRTPQAYRKLYRRGGS